MFHDATQRMLHTRLQIRNLAAFLTYGKEVNSMSDRGHIHTLIANREQQLYGSLRDGMLSFQKYLTDTIEDICRNMMYDFKDIYLKIVFETQSENADTAVVKCKYCTSNSIEGSTEENSLEISKVYKVKKTYWTISTQEFLQLKHSEKTLLKRN